ncbi:universal stress protein UspA [Secundilactobacillus oryzae JCM 18671]|uniref:Universal stress protein UspA n=1 Tax=Secundilactobacillus oryzae JCM 18671 TaxID=1291743 RepID=A0A081BJX9_9LACO|nr:universal stress protein [Secundilactobacillus oryzae]GAK48347.1 universal stress protein UspA [Secundilactobacillus oryzae JCM 18671]
MNENEQIKPLFFNNVLLTVDADDSDSTERAFRFAVTYAKDNAVKLGIVSVMEREDINIYDSLSPDRLQEKRDAIRAIVNEYAKRAQEYGVKEVEPIVGEGGDIDDVVLEQIIPNFQPELIVCGADMVEHTRKAARTVGLHLAKRASVSVIVVR